MNVYLNCIKLLLMSTLPALILGLVAFGYIAAMGGSAGADGIWLFVTFVSFLFLLAATNDGQHIFARSLKYFAYELWLSPLVFVIYISVIGSEVMPGDKATGAAIGTMAGLFFVTGIAIINGLFGMVCYMISKNMLKKHKHKKSSQLIKG